MDKFYKLSVVFLLCGILVALIAIYCKIPPKLPTMGEIYKVSDKSNLLLQCPIVNVRGTVNADVDNSQYDPLYVEIVR